ncbi:MAG: hypothetical protein KatS3mg025_1899 [Bacteroidia bacterium]|nr:MAG: hypothetical protein KatS3mg025_1899 [Bacteroidia bacterium]
MKAYWAEGCLLKQVWGSLPYAEEPFLAWEWWESLGLPWGAVVIEAGSTPQAAWPFAVRIVGPLRLHRHPLGMPWLSPRLYAPLTTDAQRAPYLRVLVEHIQRTHRSLWAGSLSPAWSYLPPFAQAGLRLHADGSFVLAPGEFEPDRELRRKLRQAENLPISRIHPSEAFAFWEAHYPPGLKKRFVEVLRRLLRWPQPWQVLTVGHPPQAVGFFLIGEKRVWYIASARLPEAHPQAMTRLLSEAIHHTHAAQKTFDFSGSILPGIERFFLSFCPHWEKRYRFSTWRL